MEEYKQVELLIVEDSQGDVELMLRTLKKNNLANKIYVVNDGAEALDFIFGKGVYISRESIEKPKVIFLDLKLPKVSGLEVLHKLKSNPLTREIPVVILSSSSEDIDLKRAYELGANSFITKPVNYEDFSRLINELGLYWVVSNKIPL
jgi:CheY-like chemotaxis protein